MLLDPAAPYRAWLRAERDGRSDGRVYTLDVAVRDAAGNEATSRCTVAVPHDQSGREAVDSGPRFCVGSGCGSIPGPSASCR
jgi:hypothetical protein